MNDLNLRQQVAERLGWTDIEMHTHDDFEWLDGLTPDGSVPDMDHDHDEIPAYDSDIAAAWELATLINPRRIEIVYRDTGVTAILDGWTGDADTAPAAICKAWLAYMESKQEQHDDQE